MKLGLRLLRLLAVLVSLSLVAAACGGDDESEGSDDDTATTAGAGEDADAGEGDGAGDAGEGAGDGEESAGGVGCDAVDLSTPPGEPVTIRLGHGAGTEEPLYLMGIDPEGAGSQYNGTFYTLELTEFTPPDRLAAYQAGDLDGGTISTPQLFTAVANGLNIMAATSIAVVSQENGFTYPYAALEDSDYATGEDLSGATIGIIAPNTATEYWAKSAIAAAGLDPDRDVSFVPVPVPNAEQALRDGQVDIQFFTAAFWVQAEAAGGVTEVFNALTGPGFNHELLDMFFDRDFVTSNPEAFCAWRADYVAANAAFTADRASFGQVLIDEGYDPAPDADLFAARPDAGRSDDAAIDLANVQALIDDMRGIAFLPDDLEVTADDIVMEGFSLTK